MQNKTGRIILLILVIFNLTLINGYPSPRRERFSDPLEGDEGLSAFFVSLAIVIGVCLALIIAICLCCRFDNYLVEVAKEMRARCKSYKRVPSESNISKSLSASFDPIHEQKSISSTDTNSTKLSTSGALIHTAYAFADHLKWSDHPKTSLAIDHAKTGTSEIYRKKISRQQSDDNIFRDTIQRNTYDFNKHSRKKSGTRLDSHTEESPQVESPNRKISMRKVSNTKRRPPLKDLTNNISIMSMQYDLEDRFGSAWEARAFLLDTDNFDELATISECELNGYRIYFNMEEWENIYERWKLAQQTFGTIDEEISDLEANFDYQEEDAMTEDESDNRRIPTDSATFRAGLRTVTSDSECADSYQPSHTIILNRIESEEMDLEEHEASLDTGSIDINDELSIHEDMQNKNFTDPPKADKRVDIEVNIRKPSDDCE